MNLNYYLREGGAGAEGGREDDGGGGRGVRGKGV